MKRQESGGATDRRSFLVTTAAAALAALLPEILRPSRASATTGTLDALWADPANACVVGRRYLALQPEDVCANTLLQDVFGGEKACSGISAASLRCALAERRQADFANGDTVIVDGWILSRTEARLCALAVLDRT